MKVGYIVSSVIVNDMGPFEAQRVYDWMWVGGDVAKLDFLALHLHKQIAPPTKGDWVGAKIMLGTLALRVLKADEFTLTVMRADDRMWRVRVWQVRLGRTWGEFAARVIATLAVWGLARWDPGVVPHWKQIHMVRWLAEQWDRVRT